MNSKNILLTVKRFFSLSKDFLLKSDMRGNPLKVKGLSFQMLFLCCQSISFGLRMKSFVVVTLRCNSDENHNIH